MRIDSELLTLTQWMSPAFPLGAFAYSHGLETAISTGDVTCADSLQDWMRALLEHGTGRNDVILIANAYDAADDDQVVKIDRHARAFCASRERLFETEQLGAAFVEVVNRVWDMEMPAMTMPVALGRAARLRNLPLDAVLSLYLQCFAGNLISAAVRLVPLGQSDGQHVLTTLAPLCLSVAEEAIESDLDDLSSTSFAWDIASMRHETLVPRIFRT